MISQLAKNTKKEDNFGMRDEDWEVYKKISKVFSIDFSQIENNYRVLLKKISNLFSINST
jgi:hypothetical protein